MFESRLTFIKMDEKFLDYLLVFNLKLSSRSTI